MFDIVYRLTGPTSVLNRIEWVDRCKCIATYLVVYGHFCLDNKYVYAFHMPVLRIVKVVFEKIYPSMNYDTDYFVDALLSLLVIVILLPAIPLYNKVKIKLPRIR